MKRSRSARGLTIVETSVGAALLVAVLAGANAMVSASSGLAQSTNNEGAASNRADRALQLLAQAIRRGSLASLQHLDGTAFSDGTNDTGFKIQAVTDYRGSAVLSSQATYQFDLPGGKPEGSILQTQDGVVRLLASGVTSLTVSRTGTLLTLDVRTRSGPTDDRGRTLHAVMQVASRNP